MMFRENQQIGYYTLVRFLGRGGFGEVWLGENRSATPPTKVAIKLPHSQQLDLQAVKDEIFNWILSGKHKNILPIIECETFGDQIAIVSEFAPDGSLRDLLDQRGKLSPGEAVEITAGILEGLAHLHQRKIIHRDLKPENVLLSAGIPKLTDFGISRAVADGSSTSIILGTQAFMAPECFDGKRTLQTDIWAIGIILYQLLSGALPFPQREITPLIGAIVMQNPPPLPEDVPPALKTIVERALAKDVAQRYQTAGEMLEDLKRMSPNVTASEHAAPLHFPPPQNPFQTPVQRQATTQILTASPKKRSKTGIIIMATLALLAAFFGAAGYGLYTVVQNLSVQQNQTPSFSNLPENPLTKRVVTDFSADLIDEIFAAIEKENGGEAKLTRLLIHQNKNEFTHSAVTVRNSTNDDYFDAYTYQFGDRTIKKRALKNPPFFEKTGGKWFSKNEVKWDAIPEMVRKVSAKAKEIGESGESQTIVVTRKFISFNPETYGEIIFELSSSGERKDIQLTADATGENMKIEVK